ncbi:lipopolysaccharide biosynthesis protein [Aerococcus urinaeequi]|uniref:lipopolysaccharide biosynthesis protein n=1 Tax=Aerococcus urinaeequi TaxID=51665 RepID=UPI003D6ABD45
MNSYKKLLNNVIIFSLGNLGSKIITFMLVPLYTYYLSQSEYGTVDLVTVTVSMLVPIVSLSMHEAVLRFVMKKNKEDFHVLFNALFISILGYLLLMFLSPLFIIFGFSKSYILYLDIILLFQILNQVLSQYARGIGKVRVFAFNGMLTTFLTGIFNILFLVKFNWGVFGYFFALILSYLISNIYLLFFIKPEKSKYPLKFDKALIKEMLAYSIPLIPNSLMWWVVSSSSRVFISIFIGTAANGLFAVSSKIPFIINLVSQVFGQGWQLSAFENYEEDGNKNFYTDIFNYYSEILFIVTSGTILILKPLFQILFSEEYFNSWTPVPFLLLGSTFSALSGFIGVSYSTTQNTKGVFTTSLLGGVTSIITNFILIPTLGIIGSGISSMLSFFVMFYARYKGTRKLITINIRWTRFILTIILILAQTGVLFINVNVKIQFQINVVIFLGILILNHSFILFIVNLVKNRKNK